MSVATAAGVPREPESDVGAHEHNPDGVEEREKGGKERIGERIGELSEGRTENGSRGGPAGAPSLNWALSLASNAPFWRTDATSGR